MKTILNLSGHSLITETAEALQVELRDDDINVIDQKVSIRRRLPVYTQIKDILSPHNEELRSGRRVYVILPGLKIAAGCVLAYIHGVSGRFPTAVELVRDPDEGVYGLHAIHDLEIYRQEARNER